MRDGIYRAVLEDGTRCAVWYNAMTRAWFDLKETACGYANTLYGRRIIALQMVRTGSKAYQQWMRQRTQVEESVLEEDDFTFA
jgi:hypothetical protein